MSGISDDGWMLYNIDDINENRLLPYCKVVKICSCVIFELRKCVVFGKI